MSHPATTFLAGLGFERATYQTKPERPGCPDRPTVLHGPHAAQERRLTHLNTRGSSIHFSLHFTDLQGRKEANIRAVNLFTADDVKPGQGYPLEPSAVVETSHGNCAAFWRVLDAPKDEYAHVLAHMARLLGSDESGMMLNKTMRLPGYLNQKPEYAEPFMARVVSLEPNNVYRYADFWECFGVPPVPPKPKPLPQVAQAYLDMKPRKSNRVMLLDRVAFAAEGTRNETLFKNAAALANDVKSGKLERDVFEEELLAAAGNCGLEPDEARDTILSALSYADLN